MTESPNLPEEVEVVVDGKSIMLDLRSLFSNYHCIYGQGCKGTSGPKEKNIAYDSGDPTVGCCKIGPEFNDDWVNEYVEEQDTPERVRRFFEDVTAEDCENVDYIRERGWYNDRLKTGKSGGSTLKTLKGKCVMLNSADHAKPGCAMYHYAERNGLSAYEVRPEACHMQPLVNRQIKTRNPDDNVWKTGIRRLTDPTWFSKKGYWCTTDPNAFSAEVPAYVTMEHQMGLALMPHEYVAVRAELDRLWELHGQQYRDAYWGISVESSRVNIGMPKMPSRSE